MAKTIIKLGSFDKVRPGDVAGAAIILDGKTIGWVERNMTDVGSGMARVYRVSNYDITLTGHAPGGEWESTGLETLAEVRAAIKARVMEVLEDAIIAELREKARGAAAGGNRALVDLCTDALTLEPGPRRSEAREQVRAYMAGGAL